MLKHLYISNFAIISELDITLDNGLIALTGETGAGKSIILGAMQLLLGGRADTQLLLNKSDKCIIEGTFTSTNLTIQKRLATLEIEEHQELIVRREISSAGRSRAFINDTPVNLTQLGDVCEHLVDIHRQFDTVELKDKQQQQVIIDTIAESDKEFVNFTTAYQRFIAQQAQLATLRTDKAAMLKELEYKAFLLKELDAVPLASINIENIEADLAMLNNVETLSTQVQDAYTQLQGAEDVNVITDIKGMLQKLGSVAQYNASLQSVQQRLQTVYVELKDIADELETVQQDLVHDPQKLDELNTLHDKLSRLLLKHGVQHTDGLLALQLQLQQD
jgi:DNA repair protein RecN (Recombination protein N)